MYTKITKDQVRRYPEYMLCYIEDISETLFDYDEETKAYMNSEEYERDYERGGYFGVSHKLHQIEIPNPEFSFGSSQFIAYFAKVKPGKVVGDDMDDRPYDCNSGIPYDDSYNGGEILMLPFGYPGEYDTEEGTYYQDCRIMDIKQPKDYPMVNVPWSTEDINLGAVPWIFARTCRFKYNNRSVSIMAGVNPEEFMKKIEEIHELYEDEKKVRENKN